MSSELPSVIDPSIVTVGALGLAAVLGAVTLLWAESVRRRDVTIADIWWGAGFPLLAWLYCVASPPLHPRGALVASLLTVWGARLAAHIALRHRGQPEDARYASIRQSYGPSFWWKSLYVVFWLQGVLMWFIAWPVLIAIQWSNDTPLGALDVLGGVLFAIGLACETIGDEQLRRFRADPRNRGRVLDLGLWRYTRHPNYFGDALAWWGLFAIAASVPGGIATIASPVLMTLLLLKVSGVSLLERGLTQTKADYADYIARTSAFVPWFPRPGGRGRSS
jgi:steroid 5-alpha reductase family enzyme